MALSFDGTANEYLSKTVTLASGRPLTAAGWILPDLKQQNHIITLVESADAGGLSNTSGYFAIGGGKYGRWDLIWARSRTSTSTNQYGNGGNSWTHLCGTIETNNAGTLYANGSSVATGSGGYVSDIASADKVYIGATAVTSSFSGVDANEYTDGLIAEVGLWDELLTTDEISALAAGFSPALIRPSALLGYWPLGGPYDGATTYTDLAAGNSLTAESGFDATNLVHHPPIIYPTSPFIIYSIESGAPTTLAVSGNSVSITTGSTATSAADNTAWATAYLNDRRTDHEFKIYNNSSSAVTITGVTFDDTRFSAAITPTTIAAYATARLVISMTPSAAGTHTAMATIEHKDTTGASFVSYTFNVTGTVVSGVPGTGTSRDAFGRSPIGPGQ